MYFAINGMTVKIITFTVYTFFSESRFRMHQMTHPGITNPNDDE